MKSHIIISTNVERAFVYIQNVSFSIAWLLSFETFSQWILIMSHTPQLIPDQLSPPYSSTFTVFPFFALNLLSPICVAQLLLDVGPGLDMVDWPRVTPLKKNPSSSLRRLVLHAVVLLCLHLRSLAHVVAIAGSPSVRFAGCVWKRLCFWHHLHRLLFHNDPWASGALCKVENSTVSYSQLVDQLWVSMFITVYYKKSLLWWQLRGTLISGHSNMPLGLMLAASMWTWHTC